MKRSSIPSLVSAALLCAASSVAWSAPVFIEGADPNLAVPGVPANSQAASAAAGLASLVDPTSVVRDSLETYDVGTRPGTLFGGKGTLSPGGGVIDDTPYSSTNPPEFFGRFNTTSGGAKWFETASSFEIRFGAQATAFGFFGTDFGDFLGTFTLQLIRPDGSFAPAETIDFDQIAMTTMNTANGSLLFVGLYEPEQGVSYIGAKFNITQCDLDNPPPGCDGVDVLGFDDFFYGNYRAPTQMPEPGSLALVGASLLGLGAARRRRRA